MEMKPTGGSMVQFMGAAMVALLVLGREARAAPITQAVWTFGDSLVDVGNNNYIVTTAKSNFPYNGIDFPAGPTGRFCNGETVVDVITRLAGFETYPPPFLQPDVQNGGPAILQGVNYASAAGGILNDTGRNYINNLSFDTQLMYFATTIASLQNLLGSQAAVRTLLANSLFGVVVGSNDYINNYLLPFSPRRDLGPQRFQNLLITNMRRQLTELYDMGGRRFMVSGLGPLGCIPSQIVQNGSNGTCVLSVNQLAIQFNKALQTLLQRLTSSLTNSTFAYANSYDFVTNIINNSSRNGFTVTNTGCCGAGPFNGVIPCAAFLGAQLCSNRTNHVFWDPFHPIQAVNELLGQAFFNGSTRIVSPVNVQQLLTTKI